MPWCAECRHQCHHCRQRSCISSGGRVPCIVQHAYVQTAPVSHQPQPLPPPHSREVPPMAHTTGAALRGPAAASPFQSLCRGAGGAGGGGGGGGPQRHERITSRHPIPPDRSHPQRRPSAAPSVRQKKAVGPTPASETGPHPHDHPPRSDGGRQRHADHEWMSQASRGPASPPEPFRWPGGPAALSSRQRAAGGRGRAARHFYGALTWNGPGPPTWPIRRADPPVVRTVAWWARWQILSAARAASGAPPIDAAPTDLRGRAVAAAPRGLCVDGHVGTIRGRDGGAPHRTAGAALAKPRPRGVCLGAVPLPHVLFRRSELVTVPEPARRRARGRDKGAQNFASNGGGGGPEPKSPKDCVPKKAQFNISFCRFRSGSEGRGVLAPLPPLRRC